MDPINYSKMFADSLVTSDDIPQFVKDIKNPDGLLLACECPTNGAYELEGDIEALKYIDLDREGLTEYKSLVAFDNSYDNPISKNKVTFNIDVDDDEEFDALKYLDKESELI